ncbi:hypothetical protein CYMTET_54087, partial [Cymbomonas tetramitiformis]
MDIQRQYPYLCNVPSGALRNELHKRHSPTFPPEGAAALTPHASRVPNPYVNKGTAYSVEEREAQGLAGLVPPCVETLELQARRVLAHVRSHSNMLDKYVYLENLHNVNVTLFYKVLLDNTVELLPVLYTPTVGEACQRFGQIFRNLAGLYISMDERGRIHEVLDNWLETPDIIVVTDGGRILGLGDLGNNGMGIPIGKLHLYVAGGGFNPAKTLPIQLDTGCDVPAVVYDPMYLGTRIPRVKGKEHEELVDEFMEAVAKKWPKCIIQFEDFQSEYALKYLERYRRKYIHFNDDVQGTAAVVTTGFINGMKAQGTCITEAKVVMFGAGSSAVGVSTYLMEAMVMAGLSKEEARLRVYMVDTKGLITTTRGDKLNEWKQQFARTDGAPELRTLLEVVKYVRPHALFGLTGAGPSFTKEVVEELVNGCPRPLIFPLSNPTSKAEITVHNAVEWSDGKCLFAAGSPQPNVEHKGKTVYASQCNNMLIFPGVGMGSKLSGAREITDNMLLAAAYAVSDFVDARDIEAGRLYPTLDHLRDIGEVITRAVWLQAEKDGVATVPPPPGGERSTVIKAVAYSPTYAVEQPKHEIPPILRSSLTFKSTGYTYGERCRASILGLMPPAVETIETQVERVMSQVRSYDKMLQKYTCLQTLFNNNANLFFKVLLSNIRELLPILYTPTVGEACQKFGEIYRTMQGMFISVKDKGRIARVLDNWESEPEIIVVTDGGRILGLGDLGAGGMGIPIGKLHLYCAGGGFHPDAALPIQLDLGCDTESVVNADHYLGVRCPRIKGKEHEELVDEFMEAVAKKWPKCIIQFEDFQSEYALKYLERYRRKYIHFNDDVQGTAAVVTTGFINGMKAQGTKLSDAKIVMFGAGSSAVGVSTYLTEALVRAGLSKVSPASPERLLEPVDHGG